METAEHRPVLIEASSPFAGAEIDALRRSGGIWRETDTLDEQLRDLARTRTPGVMLEGKTLEAAVEGILGGLPREDYGTWVFYPWSGQLVRLLPRDAFRELRLDRNRNKITREEQEHLAGKTVAVVGLSVGNAVALTIALEGACGRLRLADFDTLALSNMNRVRAAVHEIGLPKTILAARQIAEIDPWIEVELHGDGVSAENVDSFLDGVDVLVDECDGIPMKFLLRERARARRIPVLMETSDRGMIDIERFDLEGDRPVFHGRVTPPASFDKLSAGDRMALVTSIIDGEKMSPRLASSLKEIGRSLSTWPQLGSAVTLGGATVCAAVRRLLLGEAIPSGRRYVDLDLVLGTPERSGSKEAS